MHRLRRHRTRNQASAGRRRAVRTGQAGAVFVWRVLVPLTLLVIVSWSVFWFEPTGLQPQISTCMATLISLVAFEFAVDFAMPKVPYLTLTDMHAMIGFGFVAAAVVAVAAEADERPA